MALRRRSVPESPLSGLDLTLEISGAPVAHELQFRLAFAATGGFDRDDRESDESLEEAALDIEVLHPLDRNFAVLSGDHARGDIERTGGQLVVEQEVASDRIPRSEGEPHRKQHECEPDIEKRDEPQPKPDEKERERTGEKPNPERFEGRGEGVESHTASSLSLSMARPRNRSRRSSARSGASPGIVMSAPREPAV